MVGIDGFMLSMFALFCYWLGYYMGRFSAHIESLCERAEALADRVSAWGSRPGR